MNACSLDFHIVALRKGCLQQLISNVKARESFSIFLLEPAQLFCQLGPFDFAQGRHAGEIFACVEISQSLRSFEMTVFADRGVFVQTLIKSIGHFYLICRFQQNTLL